MKKQKVFYTSPEVEILELRVENLICASGEIGINGFGNDEDNTESRRKYQFHDGAART